MPMRFGQNSSVWLQPVGQTYASAQWLKIHGSCGKTPGRLSGVDQRETFGNEPDISNPM